MWLSQSPLFALFVTVPFSDNWQPVQPKMILVLWILQFNRFCLHNILTELNYVYSEYYTDMTECEGESAKYMIYLEGDLADARQDTSTSGLTKASRFPRQFEVSAIYMYIIYTIMCVDISKTESEGSKLFSYSNIFTDIYICMDQLLWGTAPEPQCPLCHWGKVRGLGTSFQTLRGLLFRISKTLIHRPTSYSKPN